ncbi:MAG: glycosyltransferase family 2 protein [Lachnospiraceae bacterium]|nr:glycosyltransferase family 2 protein [Lachnospiraceae bacterium]
MENRDPLVSIIVPVFNTQDYLQECLNSIREQSYKNLEIILVDDGSTDQSAILCEEFARKDHRIRVFHKKNGGLMSAWTYGIKEAYGEYVSFVDSDDWIELDMIEGLVREASGNAREIICSNYIIEKMQRKDSIKVRQGLEPGYYGREEIENKIIPQLLGNEIRKIHSSRCMKLISKDLILDNLKFTNDKITMGEDLSIMYPALLDADRIVIMKEGYYYHYRYVNSSIVHKYNPLLNEKIGLLYNTMRMIILTKIPEEEKQKFLLEKLKQEYLFLFFLVIKNELRSEVKGYHKRLRQQILDIKEKELGDVQIEVDSIANKILYLIWQKPNKVIIEAAKIAINLFDKR